MKFGRSYTMRIVGAQETHVISYPLTLRFDVNRDTCSSLKKAKLSLINLGMATRNDIFKDRVDTSIYYPIELRAGYQEDFPLPLIFKGNIQESYSYRSGTDWITEIDAFGLGYGTMNCPIETTLPAKWTASQVIRTLVHGIPHASLGAIGAFTDSGTRGLPLVGNCWDLLKRFTYGGLMFEDLERINALQKNEYISSGSDLPEISHDTGLLGTPRRHGSTVDVDMLFEPKLLVGQKVVLKSSEPIVNGTYQICGIQHRGTISGATCGDAVTTLRLWLGSRILKPVPIVTV